MRVLGLMPIVGAVVLSMMPSELNSASPAVDDVEQEEVVGEEVVEDTTDATEDEAETPKPTVRTGFGYEALPEGSQQPWRLVRGLQRAQDNIIAGRPRAEDAYRLLLVNLSRVMASLDNSVWNHERNVDALATFILLGGNTELGYKALQKTQLDELQTQPLKASLAFAQRDLARAQRLLAEFDPSALPPSMAAHFALARSMAVAATDIELAKTYLNEARKLAPGTLVEEAALRRLIRIAGETRSFDDLVFLSKTYMSRFRNSYYFKDFLTNVSFGLVRMPKEREEDVLSLLKQILANADMSEKVGVAIYVSRHSTLAGKKTLSYWTSELGLDLLPEGSRDYARLQLYKSAIDVVEKEKVPAALGMLEALQDFDFSEKDKLILSSALLLGKQILQDPVASQSMQSGLGNQSLDENQAVDKTRMVEVESPVVKKAEEVLSRSSELLEGIL